MNGFLRIIALILIIYYVPKFCENKTSGFTLLKIHSNLSYDSDWEVNNPPLEDAFNQKFTYLAAGGQCYAFVSEDGQYVLKFFKHHLRRLPFWLSHLPLPKKWDKRRVEQKEKRLRKLKRDFRSYKLAIEELPNETGLFFVHLNKSNDLHQKARIVDRLGIEHSVDLDKVEFILQKKATLAHSHFLKLIKENRFVEARESIESICSLIRTRCEKGIYDEDAKIHRNFGFIDNRAILIDVGRLKRDMSRKDAGVQHEDLVEITYRFNQFLEKASPQLSYYLQVCVNQENE